VRCGFRAYLVPHLTQTLTQTLIQRLPAYGNKDVFGALLVTGRAVVASYRLQWAIRRTCAPQHTGFLRVLHGEDWPFS